MDSINYELHIHDDPSFPIIFHLDFMERNANFLTHWHESIEILYIVKGSITVLADANRTTAKKGQIVIINSNNIHHIKSLDEVSEYYCLIIDKKLCEESGLYIEEIVFRKLIVDKEALAKFIKIKNEFISKSALYKYAVKSAITDFLIHLYRGYILSESPLSNKSQNIKTEMVKRTIKYIQDNYNKGISTSDIAEKVGLSRSYFCNVFKETTGYATVHYINYIRCYNAKKLFQIGNYTVSEVALLCGFDNSSYFSKTYKKHMGCLPSVNKKSDRSIDFCEQKNENIARCYYINF